MKDMKPNRSLTAPIRCSLLSIALAAGLGLSVAAAAADDDAPVAHSDSVGAAITDTTITAHVKTTLAGDERLNGSHIRVTTTNGVVTLRGTAATADARDAAERLAKDTDGVRSVDDELSTGSGQSSVHHAVAKSERVGSDSWITTKVKSELLADHLSRGFDVHVKTLHGVVMLRGSVPDDQAVAHVRDIAQQVRGVKSVDVSELRASAG